MNANDKGSDSDGPAEFEASENTPTKSNDLRAMFAA